MTSLRKLNQSELSIELSYYLLVSTKFSEKWYFHVLLEINMWFGSLVGAQWVTKPSQCFRVPPYSSIWDLINNWTRQKIYLFNVKQRGKAGHFHVAVEVWIIHDSKLSVERKYLKSWLMLCGAGVQRRSSHLLVIGVLVGSISILFSYNFL